MQSPSVKALSRGGDPPESPVERLCGKLHKIRAFRPYKRGANGPVWVQFHEDRTVERKLADVVRRHSLDLPRGIPVRLEIGDQDRVRSDHKPVDPAWHHQRRSIGHRNFPAYRHFSAAAMRKQWRKVSIFDYKKDFLKQIGALSC